MSDSHFYPGLPQTNNRNIGRITAASTLSVNMADPTNELDADSITTSSWSSTGAATPTTDTDETYSAIEEWRRPQVAHFDLSKPTVEVKQGIYLISDFASSRFFAGQHS